MCSTFSELHCSGTDATLWASSPQQGSELGTCPVPAVLAARQWRTKRSDETLTRPCRTSAQTGWCVLVARACSSSSHPSPNPSGPREGRLDQVTPRLPGQRQYFSPIRFSSLCLLSCTRRHDPPDCRPDPVPPVLF